MVIEKIKQKHNKLNSFHALFIVLLDDVLFLREIVVVFGVNILRRFELRLKNDKFLPCWLWIRDFFADFEIHAIQKIDIERFLSAEFGSLPQRHLSRRHQTRGWQWSR